MNLPIRMVETQFLSCGNRFLSFNLFFFQQVENVTETSGEPLFLGKDFISTSRKGFSVSPRDYFLLFRVSFLQVKTVTETS